MDPLDLAKPCPESASHGKPTIGIANSPKFTSHVLSLPAVGSENTWKYQQNERKDELRIASPSDFTSMDLYGACADRIPSYRVRDHRSETFGRRPGEAPRERAFRPFPSTDLKAIGFFGSS